MNEGLADVLHREGGDVVWGEVSEQEAGWHLLTAQARDVNLDGLTVEQLLDAVTLDNMERIDL